MSAGLGEEEAEKTIDSGIGAGMREPRTAPPREPRGGTQAGAGPGAANPRESPQARAGEGTPAKARAADDVYAETAAAAREVVRLADAQDPGTFLAIDGLYQVVTDLRGWTAPIPLDSPCGPDVPIDALSPWQAEFIRAAAGALQVPEAFAAAQALAVVALALGLRLEVEVRPGWREPANTYGLSVLDVGERKSATQRRFLAPVEAFEARLRHTAGPRYAQECAEREVLEEAVKIAKKKAARDPGAGHEDLRRAVEVLARSERPALPRLIADDTTVEALGEAMAGQRGRMAIVSAEGGIFATFAGRYSDNNPNIDIVLKAHAGDSLAVDRIGRPGFMLRRPALTIGLAVQPDVMRSLAASPSFRGRGLLARFAYFVPRGMVGRRSIAPGEVSAATEAAYAAHVERLLGIPDIVNPDGSLEPRVVRFAPAADGGMRDFERSIEPRLGPGGDLGALAGWGSKFAGLVARIALGIFAADRADAPTSERLAEALGVDVLERSIAFCTPLIDHAKAAFGQMGVDPLAEDAAHVAAWLAAHKALTVTKRDVYQGVRGRSSLAKASAIDPVLEVLVQNGYLRDDDASPRRGSGRPPSARYLVNPLLWGQTPGCGDCEDK